MPQVHKFGGTCVAAAERIEAICRYLISGGGDGAAAEGEQRLVVVSAMGSHPSSPVKVGATAFHGFNFPLCARAHAASGAQRVPVTLCTPQLPRSQHHPVFRSSAAGETNAYAS